MRSSRQRLKRMIKQINIFYLKAYVLPFNINIQANMQAFSPKARYTSRMNFFYVYPLCPLIFGLYNKLK